MFRVVIVTILFCLAGFSHASFAALSLSVSPINGSNVLRFEKIGVGTEENKEEIHIRVDSTNGDRYQVFQRILEPIMNEKGDSLNLQSIQTQTLSNSNSYGTLYLQNSDHLNMGDQLLYSSSQSGQSDSLTVGYSLNRDLINSSGSFRGRLVFTVRGVDNGSTDQMVIDVFLESSSRMKLTVKGGHNQDRINIKDTDTTEKVADYVNISFSGNSNREIRIYQEVETVPQNETGQELGPDVLQLDAQGDEEGLHIAGLSPLKPGKSLIFSSDKDEDNLFIYFLVDPAQVQQQDAGTYTGKIKYVVETDHGIKEFPIDVQCVIAPVFSVNVTPPPGGVNYTHVLADTPPQDKEVTVTVISNLHKPYQVIQDLQTNMTNQQGKEFNNKYFTVQVEIPSDQRGQTNFAEFSPVQLGESPIFSSDAKGSGATFDVVYRLQGYAQMNAGSFSAPLRFSLNQK